MQHVERELLSALIDGELEPEERRFVHEHLQRCDACREASEEFARVHGFVGELPRLVAPEAFVSSALRPARRGRLARLAWLLRGRRGVVAACLAVAAAAVTAAGLAVPRPAQEPPVDRLIARHVAVHSGTGVGGQVLFVVNGP